MVEKLENMLRFITNQHLTDCGQAFPTGCSLNNVAAHFTPNKDDETVLQYDDVMKLDFGTQMNGLVVGLNLWEILLILLINFFRRIQKLKKNLLCE